MSDSEKTYTKQDIIKILKSINFECTFDDKQVNDFSELVSSFYQLGLKMGMSSFITKAALHEIVEITIKNCEFYHNNGGEF